MTRPPGRYNTRVRLVPFFADLPDAISSLDNGGRIYNVLSNAGDGVVTPGELARAAGEVSAGWRAALHFWLATLRLDDQDRDLLFERLDPKARRTVERYPPMVLGSSKVDRSKHLDRLALVSGCPRVTAGFDGLGLFPSRGAVSWQPITDHMDVWFVNRTVAAARNRVSMSPDEPLTFAGILRPMDGIEGATLFLEVLMYARCALPSVGRLSLSTEGGELSPADAGQLSEV